MKPILIFLGIYAVSVGLNILNIIILYSVLRLEAIIKDGVMEMNFYCKNHRPSITILENRKNSIWKRLKENYIEDFNENFGKDNDVKKLCIFGIFGLPITVYSVIYAICRAIKNKN